MNILPSLYRESVHFFEKSVVRSLNSQQRKITLIALVVLSCLMACYTLYACCFKSKKIDPWDSLEEENFLNTVESVNQQSSLHLKEDSKKKDSLNDRKPGNFSNKIHRLVQLETEAKAQVEVAQAQAAEVEEQEEVARAQEEEQQAKTAAELDQAQQDSLKTEIDSLNKSEKLTLSAPETEQADDSFGGLPDEIMLLIISQLGLKEWGRLASTSQRFQRLSKDPTVMASLLTKLTKLSSYVFKSWGNSSSVMQTLSKSAITDQDLLIFCALYPNIKLLKLQPYENVTNAALAHLPQGLQTLIISAGLPITDKALDSLPQSLKELDIRECHQFTDAALAHLPLSLQTLHLDICHRLTSAALLHLQRLPHILKLDIGYPTTEDLAAMYLPPNLQELSLRGNCELTTLPPLPPALQTLHLHRLRNLTLSTPLPQNLKFVDLINCDLATLATHLPQGLQRLNLSQCGLTHLLPLPQGLQVLDIVAYCKLIKKLAPLPSGLKELTLYADFSTTLIPLPLGLQKLTLMCCHYFEKETFAHLPPNLHTLHLYKCYNLSVLSFLLQGLKELHIDNDENLKHADFTHLPSGLQRLYLRCRKLTDAALGPLPQGLQVLDLCGSSKLTEVVLTYLPPGLQRLILDHTNHPLLIAAAKAKIPHLLTILSTEDGSKRKLSFLL